MAGVWESKTLVPTLFLCEKKKSCILKQIVRMVLGVEILGEEMRIKK